MCVRQAERFVLTLSEVPMLRARIESFNTQEKFPLRYRDIAEKVELVLTSCRQVSAGQLCVVSLSWLAFAAGPLRASLFFCSLSLLTLLLS